MKNNLYLVLSPYIISYVDLDPGKMHYGFDQRIDKYSAVAL